MNVPGLAADRSPNEILNRVTVMPTPKGGELYLFPPQYYVDISTASWESSDGVVSCELWTPVRWKTEPWILPMFYVTSSQLW